MYGAGIKWFDRQRWALDHYVVADGDDNGVFVYEKFCGRRRFAVCAYETFCEKYLKISEDACHFYEVIPTNRPCRLHLDVDVDLTFKSSACGSVLIDQLISYVSHCLQVKYNVICSRNQILILDSSTEKKFSQHLVYPDVVFKNNIDCGTFLKTIVQAARNTVESGEECTRTKGFPADSLFWLFVDNADRTTSFVADLSIYSNNRHFRIWRSSKLGKEVPLRVARENVYSLLSDEHTFRDSMVVPPPSACLDPQYLEYSSTIPSDDTSRRCVRSESGENIVQRSSNPALDAFVLQHIRSHHMHREADISSITEFKNGCSVNYHIKGTRWCPFVEREHSSNHPYYCVQFRRGIVNIRCHSHQCKSKETVGTNVPRNLFESKK